MNFKKVIRGILFAAVMMAGIILSIINLSTTMLDGQPQGLTGSYVSSGGDTECMGKGTECEITP